VTTLPPPVPRGGRSKSASKTPKADAAPLPESRFDWRRIAYHALVSRALDDIEETTNKNRANVPREHVVLYQFSARGHDVAQAILGSLITHHHDGASAYYRSRPLLLSLGLSIEEAGEVLDISPATVKREWTMAKAWLRRELANG